MSDVMQHTVKEDNVPYGYQHADSTTRRAFTHAVIANVELPKNWKVEGEYPSEDDDFFPILCRFFPPTHSFHLSLCCPSDIYPGWLLILIANSGETVIIIKSFPVWILNEINQSLRFVAELEGQGLNVDEIISAMMRKDR